MPQCWNILFHNSGQIFVPDNEETTKSKLGTWKACKTTCLDKFLQNQQILHQPQFSELPQESKQSNTSTHTTPTDAESVSTCQQEGQVSTALEPNKQLIPRTDKTDAGESDSAKKPSKSEVVTHVTETTVTHVTQTTVTHVTETVRPPPSSHRHNSRRPTMYCPREKVAANIPWKNPPYRAMTYQVPSSHFNSNERRFTRPFERPRCQTPQIVDGRGTGMCKLATGGASIVESNKSENKPTDKQVVQRSIQYLLTALKEPPVRWTHSREHGASRGSNLINQFANKDTQPNSFSRRCPRDFFPGEGPRRGQEGRHSSFGKSEEYSSPQNSVWKYEHG
eukprot:Filipodium_phascolosomae@DN2381_c0_g1_i2.p1